MYGKNQKEHQRYKNGNKTRDRKGEVLFIDASELGYMKDRRNREFADADIQKIADTYHAWKRRGEPACSPDPSYSPHDPGRGEPVCSPLWNDILG
jgi:type I restriction-modification system DNA methylase subunit